MANQAFLKGITKLASGEISWDPADAQVFQALIVMTDTTALSEILSAEFVADIGTLDEYDGLNYVRQTITISALQEDVPNARVEAIAAASVWPNLGAGTRQGQAALVYRLVTNDADSPLLYYVDSGGFPFTGTGNNKTLNWNAEGIGIFRSAPF